MKKLLLAFLLLPIICFGANPSFQDVTNIARSVVVAATTNISVLPFSSVSRAEYNLDDTNYFNNPPAVGDLRVAYPIMMTNGQVRVTWAGGAFTANDIGKRMLVYGAQAATKYTNGANVVITNNQLCIAGTITNFVSSQQVDISATATQTTPYDGFPGGYRSAVYGTDNTTILKYAWRFCASNNATLLIPNKGYGYTWQMTDPWQAVLGDPTYSTNYHADAVFTLNGIGTNSADKITPRYVGMRGATSATDGYAGLYQLAIHGSTLWLLDVPTNVVVNGNQFNGSLFNCEEFTNNIFIQNGANQRMNRIGNAWDNIWVSDFHVSIENMRFAFPADPRCAALDLRGAANVQVGLSGTVCVDAGLGCQDSGVPTYTNGVAVGFPESLSAGQTSQGYLVVRGFYAGRTLGEHFLGLNYTAYSCMWGTHFDTGGHFNQDLINDSEGCKVILHSFGNANFYYGSVTTEGNNTNDWIYPVSLSGIDGGAGNYSSLRGAVFLQASTNVLLGPATSLLVTRQNANDLSETPSIFGQYPNIIGDLHVASNVVSGTLTTTNQTSNLAGLEVRSAGYNEGAEAAALLSTGPATGFAKLIKNRTSGNATYDSAVGLYLQDVYGGRYLQQSGSNGITYFLHGAAGGVVGAGTPLDLPLGINGQPINFTNLPVQTAPLQWTYESGYFDGERGMMSIPTGNGPSGYGYFGVALSQFAPNAVGTKLVVAMPVFATNTTSLTWIESFLMVSNSTVYKVLPASRTVTVNTASNIFWVYTTNTIGNITNLNSFSFGPYNNGSTTFWIAPTKGYAYLIP